MFAQVADEADSGKELSSTGVTGQGRGVMGWCTTSSFFPCSSPLLGSLLSVQLSTGGALGYSTFPAWTAEGSLFPGFHIDFAGF